MTGSYLGLHHKGPVHAQIMDDAIHVYKIVPFNLEKQTVNGYEGTCASHTSTEWVQCRTDKGGRRERHIFMFLIFPNTVMKQFLIKDEACACLCLSCQTCSEPQ